MTTEVKTQFTETLNTQEAYLSSLKRQKEVYKNSILFANYVITVNDLMTVGVKREKGKKWLDNKYGVLPTLYTKEDAEQNKKALEDNDNQNVKVVNRTIWYKNEIERVETFIQSLQRMINN